MLNKKSYKKKNIYLFNNLIKFKDNYLKYNKENIILIASIPRKNKYIIVMIMEPIEIKLLLCLKFIKTNSLIQPASININLKVCNYK
jgi:hypothetical protein